MGNEEKRDRYPLFCVHWLVQAQSDHSTPMCDSRCISSWLSNCLLSRSDLQQTLKIYINSSASAFGCCITMKISLSTFQHLASYLRQGRGLKSPSKLIPTAIIFEYLHANISEALNFVSSEPMNRSSLSLQLSQSSITRGKVESTSTEERLKKCLGLNGGNSFAILECTPM